MNHTFYYIVLVQYKKNSIITYKGDIPGNNALHAMKCIDNINANTWKGKIFQIALYEVDVESGLIRKDYPIVLWNNHGTVRGKHLLTATGFTPADKTEKNKEDTSHSVSKRFDPTDLGWKVTLIKRTYPIVTMKGV